jgi:transposase InsO family protein
MFYLSTVLDDFSRYIIAWPPWRRFGEIYEAEAAALNLN